MTQDFLTDQLVGFLTRADYRTISLLVWLMGAAAVWLLCVVFFLIRLAGKLEKKYKAEFDKNVQLHYQMIGLQDIADKQHLYINGVLCRDLDALPE